MKIMIIASWYPDVNPIDGIFFQERARLLAKSGCEVSVAHASLSIRAKGRQIGINIKKSESVTEYRYFKRNLTPFSDRGVAYQKIKMISRIYNLICQNMGKPDLIHLESAICARAAIALSKKENIPLSYTEHFSGILNSSPGTYLNKTMKLAVEYADHVFLISEAMKNKLKPVKNKSSMLPNGINFSEFTISSIPPEFTFKALGSLQKIKGYDLLIKAFALVKKRYSNCRLIIGGCGEEKDNLKKLSKNLCLNNSVIFQGYIDPNDRTLFFENTSAFICSSHTETFSIVIVEALACGIPVVATKCGGPEDLINVENGYLVEKNNVSALASGMMKIIENRKSFNSQFIRDEACYLYDNDIIVKNQIKQFMTLINNKKSKND